MIGTQAASYGGRREIQWMAPFKGLWRSGHQVVSRQRCPEIANPSSLVSQVCDGQTVRKLCTLSVIVQV